MQGRTEISGDVVVSAGRSVYVFGRTSGKKLYEHGFASSVLYVLPWSWTNKDGDRLFIATADGTIAMENPESPTRNYDGDEFRKQLGFPVRWSSVVLHDNMFTWLSVPTEDANRIVAFHTDLTYGETPDHDYSLDELLELARETLSSR